MDNCRVHVFYKKDDTLSFSLFFFLKKFCCCWLCWDRIKHRPLPQGLRQQPAAILSGHRSHHFRPLLLPMPAMVLVLVVGTETPEQSEVPATLRHLEARSRRRAAAEIDREIRQSHRLPPKSLIRRVSKPIGSHRITVQQQIRGSQIM